MSSSRAMLEAKWRIPTGVSCSLHTFGECIADPNCVYREGTKRDPYCAAGRDLATRVANTDEAIAAFKQGQKVQYYGLNRKGKPQLKRYFRNARLPSSYSLPQDWVEEVRQTREQQQQQASRPSSLSPRASTGLASRQTAIYLGSQSSSPKSLSPRSSRAIPSKLNYIPNLYEATDEEVEQMRLWGLENIEYEKCLADTGSKLKRLYAAEEAQSFNKPILNNDIYLSDDQEKDLCDVIDLISSAAEDTPESQAKAQRRLATASALVKQWYDKGFK